jgi:hypothetical protein
MRSRPGPGTRSRPASEAPHPLRPVLFTPVAAPRRDPSSFPSRPPASYPPFGPARSAARAPPTGPAATGPGRPGEGDEVGAELFLGVLGEQVDHCVQEGRRGLSLPALPTCRSPLRATLSPEKGDVLVCAAGFVNAWADAHLRPPGRVTRAYGRRIGLVT